VIQVSYSEIDTYRQCRHKHQLAYLEGWTPDGTSPALARGTAFHAILEGHYATLAPDGAISGISPEVRALEVKAARSGPDEEVELLEWMYDGYTKHWGDDPHWEIVATEQKLDLPLPGGVVLHATIDLIVRWQDSLWIVDHKTCKNLPKERELDLDDQLAIYIAVCRANDLYVKGGINNSIRTQRNKAPMVLSDRFSRHITLRTTGELERVLADVGHLALEAYDFAKVNARLGATGRVDAVRSPNMDTCFWKCPFTEGCLQGRKYGPVRGRQFLRDAGFTVQTPHARVETPAELAARRRLLLEVTDA
jgi:hypothetical protein